MYWRFYKNADAKTLLQLYKTFMRPHLEYCSIVWDLYLAKDSEAIEKVQRFVLTMCLKQRDLNQEELLQAANVASLASRRSQAKLSHLFKIVNELADYPNAPCSPKCIAITLDGLIHGNLSSTVPEQLSFKDHFSRTQ